MSLFLGLSVAYTPQLFPTCVCRMATRSFRGWRAHLKKVYCGTQLSEKPSAAIWCPEEPRSLMSFCISSSGKSDTEFRIHSKHGRVLPPVLIRRPEAYGKHIVGTDRSLSDAGIIVILWHMKMPPPFLLTLI